MYKVYHFLRRQQYTNTDLEIISSLCFNVGAMKQTSPDTICPIAKASELVGDMWILLIVRELLTGPKRFNELQTALVSAESHKIINSRTLTQRLQKLEQDHITSRTEFAHEKPPRVEYTLTKEGMALSTLIDDIRDFGKKYL